MAGHDTSPDFLTPLSLVQHVPAPPWAAHVPLAMICAPPSWTPPSWTPPTFGGDEMGQNGPGAGIT
eukprot:3522734-Pyramimonas_sp.AAC.1